MNNKNIKYAISIIIVVAMLIGLYWLLRYITDKNSNEDISYLRDYGVNEYISAYISDEDMAKIYLNDFVNNMLYDTRSSYDLLDEEYKNIKFGSYENYFNYIRSLQNYNITMTKFYKQSKNGYLIFGVYDNTGNIYVFKTKGVMQYSVYLDDYTVEIG